MVKVTCKVASLEFERRRRKSISEHLSIIVSNTADRFSFKCLLIIIKYLILYIN